MIYTCLPYFNEALIARIRIDNDNGYVDRLNIMESDYTFKYKYKGFNFPEDLKNKEMVDYRRLNGGEKFLPNSKLGKIRLFPYRISRNPYKRALSVPTWYNEAVQRNAVASMVEPKDNDYVILCDFDELLDKRYLPQIIQEVNKRGIITCKLRFTMFYFNLFVENWGGPSDYSYRMFIMTGKYFNNMKMTSDELRKKGERKQLLDDIYCIDEFCGFHHSWLGDAAMVLNKMGAYAHSFGEHLGSTEEYIAECIRKREAFFDGVMLKADSQVKLLPEVEKLRLTRSQLFLD